MANLNGFNANQVDPAQNFEPIPAGKYLATITESEMKPTKNGQGQYLQLTFQILDGPHKGRLLWARLNLQNSNPTTVQIAQAELSAICRSVGILQPRDSAELHNIPLTINVKCRKRQDVDEIVNEIKGYSKRESLGQTPQNATNPASGGPYAGTTPPWKR